MLTVIQIQYGQFPAQKSRLRHLCGTINGILGEKNGKMSSLRNDGKTPYQVSLRRENLLLHEHRT